jgi:tetratricopeptide (TPR) repeat protein
MKRNQILVISGTLLIGAAVFLLPREGFRKEESESKEQGPSADQQFQTQLEAVKKSSDAKALVRIEFFEDRLNKSNGAEKLVWFDSLSSVWDSQMRPGIAAEYVFQKAELSNSLADWLVAGKRYLGLARFFEGEDKAAFSQRAIDCLVKANELDPKSNEVKTQLGIAYVSGSQEPMKGIKLLLEAVSADSTNLEAQLNLGFFSMQSGQYDKAVSRFEKVLALQPDLYEVQIYLSDALEALGEKKKALKTLQELKKNSTDTLLLKEAEIRIQRIQ